MCSTYRLKLWDKITKLSSPAPKLKGAFTLEQKIYKKVRYLTNISFTIFEQNGHIIGVEFANVDAPWSQFASEGINWVM